MEILKRVLSCRPTQRLVIRAVDAICAINHHYQYQTLISRYMDLSWIVWYENIHLELSNELTIELSNLDTKRGTVLLKVYLSEWQSVNFETLCYDDLRSCFYDNSVWYDEKQSICFAVFIRKFSTVPWHLAQTMHARVSTNHNTYVHLFYLVKFISRH